MNPNHPPCPLPTRPLGQTGWQASVLTLGGVKWDSLPDEPAALRLLQRAFELGVNTFDTAHGYGGGASEQRLGRALRQVRSQVFISTKTDARSYDGARRQMDESLDRLRFEQVDAMFLHALGGADDLQAALAPNGALRALSEYKAAGRIRFIGVSGHHHRESMVRLIREYPLDLVLFPAGLFNLAYDYSYLEDVVPAAQQRGLGLMGMKIFGAGRAKHARSRAPYLRYSYHLPIDTMVIGSDSLGQLEETVALIQAGPAVLPVTEQRALFEECYQITQSWGPGEFNWVAPYPGPQHRGSTHRAGPG